MAYGKSSLAHPLELYKFADSWDLKKILIWIHQCFHASQIAGLCQMPLLKVDCTVAEFLCCSLVTDSGQIQSKWTPAPSLTYEVPSSAPTTECKAWANPSLFFHNTSPVIARKLARGMMCSSPSTLSSSTFGPYTKAALYKQKNWCYGHAASLIWMQQSLGVTTPSMTSKLDALPGKICALMQICASANLRSTSKDAKTGCAICKSHWLHVLAQRLNLQLTLVCKCHFAKGVHSSRISWCIFGAWIGISWLWKTCINCKSWTHEPVHGCTMLRSTKMPTKMAEACKFPCPT